jgi:tRNA threonylcarbamoyladenosine biosynthesis protein TsaE
LQIRTDSPQKTFALGQIIGRTVPEGTIIALTGDLGCGKTLFVQGLARGLDVPQNYYVTSPSYTLINEYPGRCRLFHADLYRMAGRVDIESTGLYELLESDGVLAIEWAEKIDRDELGGHLVIDFKIRANDVREIFITGYGQLSINLVRELEKKL